MPSVFPTVRVLDPTRPTLRALLAARPRPQYGETATPDPGGASIRQRIRTLIPYLGSGLFPARDQASSFHLGVPMGVLAIKFPRIHSLVAGRRRDRRSVRR